MLAHTLATTNWFNIVAIFAMNLFVHRNSMVPRLIRSKWKSTAVWKKYCRNMWRNYNYKIARANVCGMLPEFYRSHLMYSDRMHFANSLGTTLRDANRWMMTTTACQWFVSIESSTRLKRRDDKFDSIVRLEIGELDQSCSTRAVPLACDECSGNRIKPFRPIPSPTRCRPHVRHMARCPMPIPTGIFSENLISINLFFVLFYFFLKLWHAL